MYIVNEFKTENEMLVNHSLEQVKYVYNTYYKQQVRNSKIDNLYNDILKGIEEVYNMTSMEITVSKSCLYLNSNGDTISIDFINEDCCYELFLNTESLSGYKIRVKELNEEEVTVFVQV